LVVGVMRGMQRKCVSWAAGGFFGGILGGIVVVGELALGSARMG